MLGNWDISLAIKQIYYHLMKGHITLQEDRNQ